MFGYLNFYYILSGKFSPNRDCSMRPPIRIFIIDDHHLVRAAIACSLEDSLDVEVVGKTGTGREAIELCAQLKPDLVLLDLQVGDMDSFDMVQALRKILPNIKILVVTASADSSLVPNLFAQGVCGFFNKVEGYIELTRAIMLVAGGHSYISPGIAKKMSAIIGKLLDNPFDALSEREIQIILMVALGLTPEEICGQLGIKASTMKTYRNRFYEKLNVKNDVELTLLASRHGLLIEPSANH
jgi:two-component system invasion response regulator UvrY